MSRQENEAYWGTTNTAPSALDSFFDEDCDINWTGHLAGEEAAISPSRSSSGSMPHSESSFSIIDNITQQSTPDLNYVEGSGSSGGKRVTGVGKALGEKLDSWKPPSVSIKWNSSQGQASGPCEQCATKDSKIQELRKRLDTAFSKNNSSTLAPEDAVNRIVLGQPYSLEGYRSLEDKLALLDAALVTLDGGAMVATVLHLKNSVKKSIFMKEMQVRPHAVQLYVSYLKRKHNYLEAIDLLGQLGKTEDAAMLAYELALKGKTAEHRIKKLKKAVEENLSQSAVAFEAKIVKDHIKLLERQVAIDEADQDNKSNNPMLAKYPRAARVADKSLLTTLYYCCMYHWEAGEASLGSPLALKKAHNFTNKQLLWTVVRARARVNHWPLPHELDAWVGSKGLLGTLGSLTSAFSGPGKILPSGIKSTLPTDQVVHSLFKSGAPPNVLAAYLALVDSLDTRLKLALNYKCHQAVIDIYVAQKDREALEKYMSNIPAGSPEYVKADCALKTAKWKKN